MLPNTQSCAYRVNGSTTIRAESKDYLFCVTVDDFGYIWLGFDLAEAMSVAERHHRLHGFGVNLNMLMPVGETISRHHDVGFIDRDGVWRAGHYCPRWLRNILES